MNRRRVSSFCVGALSILFASGVSAQTMLTEDSDLTGEIQGGIAADAVGINSGVLVPSAGTFHLAIPTGARIERAILYVAVRSGSNNGAAVPALLNAFVALRGGPQLTLRGTAPLAPSNALGFGLWRFDVTQTVQVLRNADTATALFDVGITEQGDNDALRSAGFQIQGNYLLVKWTHPQSIFRRLMVGAGVVIPPGASISHTVQSFQFPGGMLSCPSGGRAEQAILSLGIASEFNVCQEDNAFNVVGGTTFTRTAGGADDGVMANPAQCTVQSTFPVSSLVTLGSFGAQHVGQDISPVETDGDLFALPTGTAVNGRLDDELYSARGLILTAPGTLRLDHVGSGDEVINIAVVQYPSDGDPDNDGIASSLEGACGSPPPDTDGDGLLDLNDPDSDNDCTPDRVEPNSAARVDPTLPMLSTCAMLGGACNNGLCSRCGTDSDCLGHPLGTRCVTGTRTCGCSNSTECAAGIACDTTLGRCLSPLFDAGTDVVLNDVTSDQSVANDAVLNADGGVADVGPVVRTRGGGCGCSTTPAENSSSAWLTCALCALSLIRRRSSRSRSSRSRSS